MTIVEYLDRLLAHAGVEKVEIKSDENDEQLTLNLDVPEEEVGVLIGHHAETLMAIQRVLRLVFKNEITKRIVLNVNGYRERRAEKIVDMAKSAADRVLADGKPYTFSYLPSHERFVVHSAISEDEKYADLETTSDGEGRDRRLTIQLKVK